MTAGWLDGLVTIDSNEALYKIYRPLLIFGQIFGINFKTASTNKFWKWFIVFHFMLAFLLILTGIGGLLMDFQSQSGMFHEQWMMTLLSLSFFGLSLSSHVTTANVTATLHKISSLVLKEIGKTSLSHRKSLIIASHILCVSCLLTSIANAILICFGKEIFSFAHMPSISDDESLVWVDFIIVFYSSMSLIYCCCNYIVMCLLVAYNLKSLGKRMLKDKGTVPIVAYERKYQILQQASRAVNNLYSLHCFFIFCSIVPMLCVILYMLAMTNDQGLRAPLVFWLCFLLTLFFFYVIPAILIYDTGDVLLDVVYEMHYLCFRSSAGVQQEIDYLVNHINTTHTGISAAGFFVITRQFILTLFSAVATYFVIMLQFGLSLETKCTCNVTNVSQC